MKPVASKAAGFLCLLAIIYGQFSYSNTLHFVQNEKYYD